MSPLPTTVPDGSSKCFGRLLGDRGKASGFAKSFIGVPVVAALARRRFKYFARYYHDATVSGAIADCVSWNLLAMEQKACLHTARCQ